MSAQTERALYAEVLVREWGEPDRYQEVGPFAFDPDDDDPEGTLEHNLRERGDDVIRVWFA